MNERANIDINQLINEVEKLHSLPTVYYQLDKAINDPTSSNDKIAAIISEDTGLATRLLRLANSAFFNFPSKVDTISMAISVIGTRQIRDLALATSVVSAFDGIPDDVINMQKFWEHSIATGVCARLLGTSKGENNIETFFVTGLIHEVGSLALYSQLPDLSKKLISHTRKDRLSLCDVERKLFRADHALLGAMLLKKWKLPHHIVEAVQYHHAPSKAPVAANLIDTTHLADIIVTGMLIGNSGDILVPKLDIEAEKRVGFSPSGLSKLVENLQTQYREVFDIVVGK